jgi:carbamoyltransferase
MAVVLGVNGASGVGHDAAAALAVDSRAIAAVEEERLVRRKRAYGCRPLRAMREVLAMAGLGIADVDYLAYPWVPHAMGMLEAAVESELLEWCRRVDPDAQRLPTVRFVDHHAAHAWAGIAFVPRRARRRVGIIVLDGSGEATSGACYKLSGGHLMQRWSLAQAGSLGIFYEALSKYLGFRWGEEGKTMGLAAYGRDIGWKTPELPDDRVDSTPAMIPAISPRAAHEQIRHRIIDDLHAIHGDHLTFNQRADVAFSGQRMLEGRILAYVNEIVDQLDVLVLSGGVALNCTANARVAEVCRDKSVCLSIPPPASDTGVALGAAVACSADPASFETVEGVDLGRAFDQDTIVSILGRFGVMVRRSSPAELADELLAQSAVCGWFEGGSEVGPRALGRRCLIARPDSTHVRDVINTIKGRESWRPLAPSLTPAEFARYFPQSTRSPYMLIGAACQPSLMHRLEGVVHVDGTSRPQVVDWSGAYRELLVEMGMLNGTEAVVCTSFNQAGKPLVYTPSDALRSARRMGLDLLAGDGWMAQLR